MVAGLGCTTVRELSVETPTPVFCMVIGAAEILTAVELTLKGVAADTGRATGMVTSG